MQKSRGLREYRAETPCMRRLCAPPPTTCAHAQISQPVAMRVSNSWPCSAVCNYNNSEMGASGMRVAGGKSGFARALLRDNADCQRRGQDRIQRARAVHESAFAARPDFHDRPAVALHGRRAHSYRQGHDVAFIYARGMAFAARVAPALWKSRRAARRILNLAAGFELAAARWRCAQCADGSAESHGRGFSGGRSAKVAPFVTR